MYFDRYDIIEGHFWFCVHYHGGQGSDLYARSCRIDRYYSPGPCQNGPTSENACVIYNNLERKHGYKRTHYKVLPSGAACLV